MLMNYIVVVLSQLKSKKGQGMVEYGLIIGLIAVLLVGVLLALTGGLGNIFGKVTDSLTSAGAATPLAT